MRSFRLVPILLVAAFAATVAPPASAASRDMVQLQTQIQQLQDAVARLQQSNDERMGVLKDLVQQNADSVNRMSATVETIQKQLGAQVEAQGGKVDQVSGQVQSLNDSLDEIKARLGRLEKSIADVQRDQQSIGANLQSGANLQPGTNLQPGPANSAPAPNATSAPAPSSDSPTFAPAPTSRRGGKPSASLPELAPTSSSAGAPPVDELYKTALGDYMGAKYGLAASEFGDITRSFPNNPLAGNAFYYQGEIDYRAARYSSAIKNYDRVLEQYPDNTKVPVAHLHKGQALTQLKQTDAAAREFRALVQRFPNSPEATQARSRLLALGASTRSR